MPPFEPENALEQVLVAAAADASAWETFYRLVLDSPLYVIDEGPDPVDSGAGVLSQGSMLQIRHVLLEGILHVPAFSSMRRLEAMLVEPRRYASLVGRDLFHVVRGSHVILNFGAAYGKQFVPAEIDAMLGGAVELPEPESSPLTPRRRRRFGFF